MQQLNARIHPANVQTAEHPTVSRGGLGLSDQCRPVKWDGIIYPARQSVPAYEHAAPGWTTDALKPTTSVYYSLLSQRPLNGLFRSGRAKFITLAVNKELCHFIKTYLQPDYQVHQYVDFGKGCALGSGDP